jgi:hypothetical protein
MKPALQPPKRARPPNKVFMSILYDLAYIVVALFVTALFLAAAVFPFWKVRARMKSHHPDLWAAKGPFDWEDFKNSPAATFADFMTVVSLADRDEILLQRDKAFIRWTRLAREIYKIFPVTLKDYFVYFILFAGFVLLVTHLLMGALVGLLR